MPYSEALADRIRSLIPDRTDIVEKKMFGGIAWMVSGHMSVGINGNELMVRLGKDAYKDALAEPGAREMDFTGRALKGFVYVSGPGIDTDESLTGWIHRSLAFVDTLAPK